MPARYEPPRRPRIERTTQASPHRGLGGFTQLGHTRRCSYAYAVAAARDDTPSLVKMLLTCRSTVRSLRTSSAAMALLVWPVATRRSSCTSRAVNPPTAL